jgi:transcriptional regulator with XRE-family HTH domain
MPVKTRSIYPNLKLKIYSAGLRQNQLAALVGINQTYLSRIINGVCEPGEAMQAQIAKTLGCDRDWLFQRVNGEGRSMNDWCDVLSDTAL